MSRATKCIQRIWADRHSSPHMRAVLRQIIRDARLHRRLFGGAAKDTT